MLLYVEKVIVLGKKSFFSKDKTKKYYVIKFSGDEGVIFEAEASESQFDSVQFGDKLDAVHIKMKNTKYGDKFQLLR